MKELDFLTFPMSLIKRSIRDIDSSYRNPWDIYAELAQNSVDAINKTNFVDGENGIINITVNSQNKEIIFEDNGCGINKDDLPGLLRPFSSGKEGDSDTVGEKGVGLKFVYFSSKFFEIVTSDGVNGVKAVIRDARLWKQSSSEDSLMLSIEDVDDFHRGTKIHLKDIVLNEEDDDESISVFKLSFNQLKYVLRTKTYLGNTSSVWGEVSKPIQVNLDYTDCNGDRYTETISNTYQLPIEALSSSDVVDIDDFEEWLSKADRTDDDKRNKLQGKVLVSKGTYLHNGYRKISYFSCFLPTRRDWENINKYFSLLQEDSEESIELKYHYCLCNPGIYTAIKGMPTGISVENPSSGNAGYWPNFFMLFQDDALKFDIGRKSIHGKTQTIYQTKAKEIFNKITKYVTKYTSAIPVSPASDNNFDRFKIKDEIDRLAPMPSCSIDFEKIPSEQEAAVSAIFFEMIGNGLIDDIKPIYLGYRQKYDLYAYYQNENNKKFGFLNSNRI